MDTFPLNVQPAVTPAAASCDEKLMFAFFFFLRLFNYSTIHQRSLKL